MRGSIAGSSIAAVTHTPVLDKPIFITHDTATYPLCQDYDDDCDGVRHSQCWMHDPTRGLCPYLYRKSQQATQLNKGLESL